MKRLLLVLIPVLLFAQIEVDTVVRLPSFVLNGYLIPELNKLYVYGWYEHIVLDCSTYQVRARIPRTYSQSFGQYSWNWRRQKLYIGLSSGADSVTVIDAVADTIMRMIPRVGDEGVYVGSTDRFYRPLAHIGLVGIDCATDTVVSTIPVPESGYGFSHPSWDSVHNKLYVPIDGWGYPDKVTVYDCATDSLLAVIDVPSRPNVMNFDYVRHKAYFTSYDFSGPAGVIDTDHDTLLRVFPFDASPLWNGVALDTKDQKAYILGQDTSGYLGLYVIDCTTDSIIKMLTFPHKPWPVDGLRWVPWSDRVYLTRTQAPPHQNQGMYVVDCKTDSIIVSNLVLGYWPPFDFQIDPIHERVFAIRCESTTVHVLRDFEGGVAEDPATAGSVLSLGLQVEMTSGGYDVRYSVASPSRVDLSVYDLMGREVKRLVAGEQAAGQHCSVWNRTDHSGAAVARGVYFVRLDAAGSTDVKKAVVTR